MAGCDTRELGVTQGRKSETKWKMGSKKEHMWVCSLSEGGQSSLHQSTAVFSDWETQRFYAISSLHSDKLVWVLWKSTVL